MLVRMPVMCWTTRVRVLPAIISEKAGAGAPVGLMTHADFRLPAGKGTSAGFVWVRLHVLHLHARVASNEEHPIVQ